MAKESVKKRLLKISDSLDERIAESTEYLFFFPEGEEANYHEGRKEALEVTMNQIKNLFAEELIL